MAPLLLFSLLSLLLLSPSSSQEANTDLFFIKSFLLQLSSQLPPSSSSSSSSSPCSLPGLSCSLRGDRILSLSAPSLGLSGPIPENTIGKLSLLQRLDLSGNNLTGFSSDFWGLGSSLLSLNLSHNQLSGRLPNDLGNLGLLHSLDLSRNELSGEIPSTLASLSSIRILNLNGNGLEGEIPEGILSCTGLTGLDLASNRLSGRLRNLSSLPALSFLNLSRNLLHGPVNALSSPSLRTVDLSGNQFQGGLSFSSLSPLLEFLDLSGNSLTGELFLPLNRTHSLTHLNLAGNRFSRQRFPEIRSLTRLRYLNLSATGLVGAVSGGVSQLRALTVLDLSGNHLTGRVPGLGSAVGLTVVDFSRNNLTGELPPALLLRLPRFRQFNFSFNNITICGSQFPLQRFKSSFLGALNDCPFAADPKSMPETEKRRRGVRIAVAVAVAAAAAAAAIAVLSLLWLVLGRRRTRRRPPKPVSVKEDSAVSGPFSFQTDSTTWVADVGPAASVPLVIFEKPLLSFTFSDLLTTTCNFDRGTLLAEGRFGPVYRGFLPGGLHVAVKVLPRSEGGADDGSTARELDRLGRIRHPNLVPLAGYCIAGGQRIAIYEYMDNGNLQNLLHDLPLGLHATEDWSNDTWDDDKDGAQSITSEGHTTWRFRHKIALGVARALAFLHHGCIPQIVHMDVKASSVYLDSRFEPRLADFGLARLIGGEVEAEIAKGSPGYSPPERAGGEATAKCDVYGFGVVLFELVTGKKPLGDEYGEGAGGLVEWVRTLVRKNEACSVIDPKLRETGPEKHMEEALRIGYLCTADSPSKRPPMQQIVGLLKDIEPLSEP